jgi:hypothetical protein
MKPTGRKQLASETATAAISATAAKPAAATEAAAAARAATAATRPAASAALRARCAGHQLRLHRNKAFALGALAGKLAGAANRLRLLAGLLF